MGLLVYIMHLNVLQHYFNTQILNQSSIEDSNFDFMLNTYIMVNTRNKSF